MGVSARDAEADRQELQAREDSPPFLGRGTGRNSGPQDAAGLEARRQSMQDLARRYRVLTLVMLGAISIAEASRRLSLSYRLLRDDYQREADYRHEVLGLRAQVHQMLLELGTRVEMATGVEN